MPLQPCLNHLSGWEEVLRRAHNLDIPQDERPQIVFLQGQEIPTSSIDFNAMLQNALAEKQNLKE